MQMQMRMMGVVVVEGKVGREGKVAGEEKIAPGFEVRGLGLCEANGSLLKRNSMSQDRILVICWPTFNVTM